MKKQNYPKVAVLKDDSTTWCRTVFSAARVTKILPDMESSSIYSQPLCCQHKQREPEDLEHLSPRPVFSQFFFSQHQNWVSGNHTVSFKHRLQPVFLLRVCHREVLILSRWYRSVSDWVVSFFCRMCQQNGSLASVFSPSQERETDNLLHAVFELPALF